MTTPPRKILLNPGPLTTTEAVKRALMVADICPREAEFGAVARRVREALLRVAGLPGETHVAIPVAGPGTAAIEAALGTLIPAAGRLLVVENGAYGRRAAEIAGALGLNCSHWRLPWTRRPCAEEFAEELSRTGCTHVFWVHHETTTGLLNPLAEWGALCRARGVVSLVDAMSSFAGLDVDWAASAVDVVISSANKCLQGMPGVSFVLGPRDLFAAPGPARSVALDLRRHLRTLDEEGQFPFTPPVHVVYALERALEETLAEGVTARAARYRANHETLVAGMAALGFETLLPADLHSGLLTAYRMPAWPGFSFTGFHDWLYARDITVYPGKLAGADTFRVAVIGDLRPSDIRLFLDATRAYLADRVRPSIA